MQLPSGAVARRLNRRKGHEGSVWEHPYHCTMIQDGRHLLNCLRYVDLNMVRAGVVEHPQDWRWCGYDELTGKRKRYRLIDVPRLLQSLDLDESKDLARLHTEGVENQIARRAMKRQAFWSESLAVGNREYIDAARKQHWHRIRFDDESVELPDQTQAWVVREATGAYLADSESESPS